MTKNNRIIGLAGVFFMTLFLCGCYTSFALPGDYEAFDDVYDFDAVEDNYTDYYDNSGLIGLDYNTYYEDDFEYEYPYWAYDPAQLTVEYEIEFVPVWTWSPFWQTLFSWIWYGDRLYHRPWNYAWYHHDYYYDSWYYDYHYWHPEPDWVFYRDYHDRHYNKYPKHDKNRKNWDKHYKDNEWIVWNQGKQHQKNKDEDITRKQRERERVIVVDRKEEKEKDKGAIKRNTGYTDNRERYKNEQQTKVLSGDRNSAGQTEKTRQRVVIRKQSDNQNRGIEQIKKDTRSETRTTVTRVQKKTNVQTRGISGTRVKKVQPVQETKTRTVQRTTKPTSRTRVQVSSSTVKKQTFMRTTPSGSARSTVKKSSNKQKKNA